MGNNCSRALGCARETPPQSTVQNGYKKVAEKDDNKALMETRMNEPPKKRGGRGHCISCVMFLLGIALIGGGCGMNADAIGLFYKWFSDGQLNKPTKASCNVKQVGKELGVQVDGVCDSYMRYFEPDKRTASEKTTKCPGKWRQVPKGAQIVLQTPTFPSSTAPVAGGTPTAPVAGGTPTAPVAGGTTIAPVAGGTTIAPVAGGTPTIERTINPLYSQPASRRLRAKNSRELEGSSNDCYEISWALVSLVQSATEECAYPNGWGNGVLDASKVAPAGSVVDCYVWEHGISLTSDTVGGFPFPNPFIGGMAPVPLLKAFLIPLGFVVSFLSCFMCCCGC